MYPIAVEPPPPRPKEHVIDNVRSHATDQCVCLPTAAASTTMLEEQQDVH